MLVHRFSNISIGLHARDYVFFRNWTHQNRGYFEGGRRHICTNLRPQSLRTPPIFPRTERVLAQSPATLRESCSTEMKRIWPFCPRPTLKRPGRPLATLRVDATRRRWLGPSTVRSAASTRMAHKRPFVSRRYGHKPKNATRFRRCACLPREVAPLATVHFEGGI